MRAVQATAFIEHRRAPVRKQTGTRNKNQYRLACSRKYLAEITPWPTVPLNSDLIAIADALVKYLGKGWHTWYFILVRPIEDAAAIILPPYHRCGTEVATGWREAFDALDPGIRSRIKALVCDGHRGLATEAKWNDWKLQRCHFHLIARLQARRSKWKTGRHYEEGKHIYKLVKTVLTAPDEEVLQPIINKLEEISWMNNSPEIRKVLSGFVSSYQDYRTYLTQPDLRLPTTNNAAETLISLIEELSRRGRGFRTVETFEEWIAAIVKIRKVIQCQPKNQQN